MKSEIPNLKYRISKIGDKCGIRKFVSLPFQIYKNCPFWVPPLISDELDMLDPEINPSFKNNDTALWIAYRNNEPAGRIAGIINRDGRDPHKGKTARFGWLDFIDDPTVSKLLFETFEDWARQHGCDASHGPLGFTDLDKEGVLIQGFDQVGTALTSYNHNYYNTHMENLKYRKEMDWLEYKFQTPSSEKVPVKAAMLAKMAETEYGLEIIDSSNSKTLLQYTDEFFDLLDDAYSNIDCYIQLDQEQRKFYFNRFFRIMSKEFSVFLKDRENRLAGFMIGMPSLSEALIKSEGKLFPLGFIRLMNACRKPKKIEFCLAAIRPELRGKAVTALFMRELCTKAIDNRIESFETNIELENNSVTRNHWKYFNPIQHKRRRCYIKYFST